ncbi:MAG: hypothetical protein RLZZ524_2441 [Pseudomonadota bacterium]
MLVECGFVRAVAGDGREWTFTPSLGRIAALDDPAGIVRLFADLHSESKAEAAARYVLACLCDQDDATPLIGWIGDDLSGVPGAMPAAEQVVIARHLMVHGIVGSAKPGARGSQQGSYSERFEAAEYIALARVHLGMSSADAEALSMTELQQLLALKFPQAGARERDVPSREEYEAGMAAMQAILAAKGKRSG